MSAPRPSATIVGLLIDRVTTTPFATPFIEAARDEAAAHGWLVAPLATGRDAADDAAALDVLAGKDLAGVLDTTPMAREVTPPDRLATLPAVLLNCHERGRRIPSVLPADAAGSATATGILVRAGHRRIARIPGETWGEAARDRQKGYRQALADHHLPADPALMGAPAWTVSSGRAAMAALLDLAAPPTAVTCFNDRVAMGACDAIRARGLAIPADISVTGRGFTHHAR